jgi:hypothetical protein
MKFRLRKLAALTVPLLAALAITPGTASAWSWSLQPGCSSGFVLTSASLTTKKADANGNGLVCVYTRNAGNVKDDSLILVLLP